MVEEARRAGIDVDALLALVEGGATSNLPSLTAELKHLGYKTGARIKLEQAMKLASHRAVTHAAVTSVAGAAAAAAAAAAPTLGGGGMSERMDERQRKREEEEAEAAFRRSTFATMLLNSAQDGWIEEDLALFRSRAVTAAERQLETSIRASRSSTTSPFG